MTVQKDGGILSGEHHGAGVAVIVVNGEVAIGGTQVNNLDDGGLVVEHLVATLRDYNGETKQSNNLGERAEER